MIPKHFVIDAIDWEVKFVDMTSPDYGECRGDDSLIMIASRLTQQRREQTFWHEILHAILESRETSWEEDKRLTEEEAVRLFASGIHSVLENNCEVTWKNPGDSHDAETDE